MAASENIQESSQPAFQELDEASLSHVVGGYLGPDDNISDFPVWALPYINIARVGVIRAVGH